MTQTRQDRRRSIRRLIADIDRALSCYGAALVAVSVALVAILGAAGLWIMQEAALEERRSSQITRVVSASMAAAYHQQSKWRHYAVNDDAQTLVEAERRRRVFEEQSARLATLTRSDPVQSSRVEMLRREVRKAAAATQSLDLSGLNARQAARLFEGEADMTAAREIGEGIGAAEARAALDRHQELMAALAWLRTLLTVVAVPAFALSGLYAYRSLRGLVRSEREARSLAEAKSRALAIASHEIRTPLNGILGMAEAMAAHPLPTDQRQRLDVMRESGELLTGLLNDLLDASKLEAGRLELVQEPLDIRRLLSRVQANFTAVAASKSVGLNVEVAPDCAPWRTGDALRLGQIVSNLVSNALKFTDKGQVTISARQTSVGLLRLEVRDTGAGMSAETVSRLFKPFNQASAKTSHRHGGTGLGLSIAQSLAELMGSRILVESSAGAGSRFYMDLPLPVTEPPSHPEIKAPTSILSKAGAGLRVLAVDDNPANRQVLVAILSSADIGVRIVDSGRAALQAYQEEVFDGILLDLRMPGLDGFDTAAAIREVEAANGLPAAPLALFSADSGPEVRERAAALGFVAHIDKPLRMESLLKALSLFETAAKGRGEPVSAETSFGILP